MLALVTLVFSLVSCGQISNENNCVSPDDRLIEEIRDGTNPGVTLDGFQAVELSDEWGDDMQ